MLETRPVPFILAITGASGAVFGVRALEMLREAGESVHLLMSKAGERTLVEETGRSVASVRDMADVVYPAADIGAAIASGSFKTKGMLIAPASIKTCGEIAACITSTLVTRAADVTLKERRKLVLMVRETPLHTGHLRMLTQLSEVGAIIAPPVPAFYSQPTSLNDMIDQTAARMLDLFEIDVPSLRRWKAGE